MKKLELYIHIPFCVRKCGYCDFLSFPGDDETITAYLAALVREIDEAEATEGVVSTVFIGGGTPSLLAGGQIAAIMDVCRRKYRFAEDAEITIEANPGTLDKHKLETYCSAGINRLSLGLQSSHNHHLEALGRIHTWEAFLESYQLAITSGFTNINIDLMSGLPGQTPAEWRSTLANVIALGPEHISAYSLIIEEGTPFYQRYSEEDKQRSRGETVPGLPSEEAERMMCYDTEALLKTAGYHRYELSNYAKTGYQCRHNIGYWERTDYRGFGLGAASLQNEVRFRQTRELTTYLSGDFAPRDKEVLDRQSRIEETMFLGLRLTQGISIEKFKAVFGETPEQVYSEVIADLIRKGLLEERGDYLRLTSKGSDISNYVMAEFLL